MKIYDLHCNPIHELNMKIYSTFGLQKLTQGQIAKSSLKVVDYF